jgi:predicted Fe-Mo cluster-binding NifX family protein
MIIKIACGTDDGENFTQNHFGDSEFFLIYKYDPKEKKIEFLEKIVNSSEDEEEHGSVKKAEKVSDILRGVSVLVAFTMGPNIVRMRKKFVPVISREKNISKAMEKIRNKLPEIIDEITLSKKEDKKIFIIDK